MRVNNLLLPHPVLGRGDDVLGKYNVMEDSFVIEQDGKNTKLSALLNLENKTLENLIAKKIVNFNIEIECPATFFRKSFLSSENKIQVELDKNILRDKVIVSFFITAINKITDYSNSDANEDYQNTKFDISEGDVLAYAGTISFNADILWEDLRRIFNIIKIRPDERENGPAIYQLNGDVIFISVSKNDYINYDNYKEENENFTSIYHTSLVLPCLVFALTEMMSDRGNDYKEYKWYRVLDSRRINEPEINRLWDLRGVPELAQVMLGNPYSRTFDAIKNLSIRPGDE